MTDFTSVPLLTTGDWIDAAWGNTYWRDNFAALFPYTTAGDMAYASSSSALSRLGVGAAGSMLTSDGSAPQWSPAIGAAASLLYSTGSAPAWLAPGAALKYLRVASGGGSLEWAAGGISVTYFYNETGHTYGTATWRDMPNSSKSITVATTSTVACIGHVTQYATDSPNYYGFFDCYFSIDGNNITGMTTKSQYGNGVEPRMVAGLKTGITAGTKTVKLREYCGSGSYGVTQILYMVFIIPE